MIKLLIIFLLFIVFLTLFLYSKRKKNKDLINPEINLKLTSTAFADGETIPVKYTGRGEDLSPQLYLHNIDPNAKTIAIIMDDLDHPLGIFNHWVIWNIPAKYNEIPEGVPRKEIVASLGGAVQGKSAYGGKHWYRGPLPPFGKHKYEFKVYVLDIVLELNKNAGKNQVQKTIEGHVLQHGKLVGEFGS